MAAAAVDRKNWRYRLNVAARTLAATVGAYAVAATLGMAIARVFGRSGIESVMAGTFAAFLAIPAAAIWAFLARGPWRAWAGIMVLVVLFGGTAWLVGAPVR